jgi:Tfp pilus assembly protein PilN
MTTLTTTQLTTLPRVNLLPPEVEEQRRLRKVQVGLGAALLAALGAVGALTVLANGAVGDAQSDLDQANARGRQLQAQQNQYAEVPLVYAQVEAAQAQLSEAMGKEIRWSYFMNDISLRVPSSIWLTKMTVTQQVDGPAVATTAGTGSYLTPGIGSVQFEGKGLAHNNVAAWLDRLAKQKGLSQPYFTSSRKELIDETVVVSFASEATVTDEALSQRYTQKAGS